MAFKDTYRLEKVYYENIWTLLNLLKNIDKNNVDMGTVKELLDNAIADNESIIIIYKNLGELYAELQNQHMELGKELEKLKDSLEEFKDEINDKIDENHNYIMGLIREIEQRLDDLENRVEDLEERMTQAETDIDSLEGRMTTAEGDIDALEQNKQDKLTAGTGIEISTANVISSNLFNDLHNPVRLLTNNYTASSSGEYVKFISGSVDLMPYIESLLSSSIFEVGFALPDTSTIAFDSALIDHIFECVVIAVSTGISFTSNGSSKYIQLMSGGENKCLGIGPVKTLTSGNRWINVNNAISYYIMSILEHFKREEITSCRINFNCSYCFKVDGVLITRTDTRIPTEFSELTAYFGTE